MVMGAPLPSRAGPRDSQQKFSSGSRAPLWIQIGLGSGFPSVSFSCVASGQLLSLSELWSPHLVKWV